MHGSRLIGATCAAVLLVMALPARAEETLVAAVAASGTRQVTIPIATPQEIADDLVVPPTVTLAFVGEAPSHGQSLQIRAGEELVTVTATAATHTAMELPANAVVFAVSARVVAEIPTATTFTVACGERTVSTAPVSTKTGSADAGTAGAPFALGAAPAPIVIVPDRVPADDSGRLRVTAHYYVVTPPTN